MIFGQFVSKIAAVLGLLALSLPVAATAAPAAAKQRLSFRTVKPIAAHFDTDKDAAANEKTLQQIGCETKREQHNGHIDVRFECKFWKTLTLNDAAEVAKWDKWLTEKGFVVVQNTPSKDHKITVKYQLKDWRKLHFDKPIASQAHVEMFKMLGCEVKTEKHNDHEDVAARCPGWQTIGLPNHATAHAWEKVLKDLGFVTIHEH